MDYGLDTIPGQVITRELTGGERLVWSGRPRQGIYFRGADAVQTLFGIPFLGFSLVWEYKAVESGNIFTMLWGIPFIVVGLHILVGHYFWNVWVRSKTDYGLTDRRAIVVRRGTVTSIPFGSMAELSFSDGPGTRGTITFGPEPPAWQFGSHQGVKPSPQFEQIENGREVYNHVLGLRSEAPGRS